MKVKNKNTQQKFLIIAAVVILILGASLLWFKKTHRSPTSTTIPSTGPTAEQKQAESAVDATNKKNFVEDTKPTNTDTPTTTQGPTIELSAQQESNGSVTVFTKLHQISNGTCSLNVKNGAKQSAYTADVIYQPEYSTCAGFSVPVSSLSSGSWGITLTVVSNTQTYSKNITYDVK